MNRSSHHGGHGGGVRLHGEQRGFVLLTVLFLAIAYFGLMQLMLVESSEALRSASRFRSRILAQVLAENAAELGANSMILSGLEPEITETNEGTMKTAYRIDSSGNFELHGEGTTAGTLPVKATVQLFGQLSVQPDGTFAIRIDRSIHSQ